MRTPAWLWGPHHPSAGFLPSAKLLVAEKLRFPKPCPSSMEKHAGIRQSYLPWAWQQEWQQECHVRAVPALEESPALAELASMDSFVQVMSCLTECLPHPLCLFQTCSTFKAKLRSIFLQKPSLTALGPSGLSSLNSQVSAGH